MKFAKKLQVALIFVFMPVLLFAISTPNVTVFPTQTNNFASYTISAATGNFGYSFLDQNLDSIIVIFNANTTVPNNFSASYVTVNNVTANSLVVTGQRVAIVTPVNIARQGGPFTVRIDAGAKIRNPATAGNYTLQVATTKETAVPSNTYTITQSSSTVSGAAVTPNPSVASETASYVVAFDVGSGGALQANTSTITIEFPVGTNVPEGALSGVTLNGTSASANALNDSVVITTPVNIENSASIQISFALGVGIINPTTASTYTLDVKTSSEPTFIPSDQYIISPAGELSISAITTKPDTVNQGGTFEFEFRTGSTGAMTAQQDSVVIIFAPNTYLPADMSPANVTLSSGGYTDNAYAVEVMKNDPTDEDTIKLVTPFDIGAVANVLVTLNSASGYLNPSVAGNYTMKLRTSSDTGTVESNPFSIFNTGTTVSQAMITPNVTTTGVTSVYTIDFSLGRLGRLYPGGSTITFTFDNAYGISGNSALYDNTRISVGGSGYTVLSTSNITANATAKTVQIAIPQGIQTQNSDNISIIIDGTGTDPITNPNSQGNYVVGLKTSVEPTNTNSATYNIGGTPITLNSVTLGDPTVNGPSSYTFNISTTLQLRTNQSDNVKIVFPEGTVIPTTIAGTNVTINGNVAASVAVNVSNRTITAYVSTNTNAGTFDVVVTSAANIKNPAVPSTTFYKATVNTSKNQVPITSAAYAITGDATTVTVNSVTANPSVINAPSAAYTIQFTTTATGKIVGGTAAGSSTISVDFTETVVPASISPSSVSINSQPSQNVSVLSSGPGGVVRVTLPLGVSVNNSTMATVVFDTSAGLINGSTSGPSNLSVRTSSDTTYGIGTLNLADSQSLSFTSVTVSPATQNALAGHSIKFKTGSPGGLAAGDIIFIAFPANTGLPSTMSSTDLTINGSNPSVTPWIIDDTLFVRTPSAINPLTNVTILINQAAGILNPSFVGSYTMNIGTSAEPGPYTSPSYNISQTSTTTTPANVVVETPTPTSLSRYDVSFSTGANGRLVAGTSTITITFNASTTVNGTPGIYNNTSIVVGGTPTTVPTTNITVVGRAVTLIVPTGVNIGNSQAVTVVIDGTTKPITNPGTSANYTLQVKTSVETSNITSNTYTISNVTPVTNVSASATTNTVNATSEYTVNFTAGVALTGGSGTITVTYPSNTVVPASILATMVTVAHGNPTPGTPASASAVVTNPSSRSVTITVPATIAINDVVQVVFSSGVGLQNPSIAGNYTLQVRTSSQPLNATSSAYTIAATVTTIVNFQVSATPNTPGELAQYNFSFSTGAYGRLVSGSSTITLVFPYNATFEQGAPATSKVIVNSTAAAAVVLNEGAGTDPDELVITVPASVTIGNNTPVSIVISSTSGLRNATSGASLTYGGYTSVETGLSSTDYSLPVELSTFEVKSDYGRALLNWVTESEVDNAYWIIEKKELSRLEYEAVKSGKMLLTQTVKNFEEAARVEGRGNTAARSEYSLVDSLVQAEVVYAYRLADVSYSGVTTFHKPVFVEITAPAVFELMQNYPNPFNPITTIEFKLPKASDIELRIYNILGQEVVTLLKDVKKAGFYKIQWNGRDKRDHQVSSGIYLYLLTARSVDGSAEFKDVNKMVLLK